VAVFKSMKKLLHVTFNLQGKNLDQPVMIRKTSVTY
jgi:hypothetical protein